MTTGTRVLLTGGGGMVGRNILEHPGARRWEILAPARSALDLRDYDQVKTWMLRERPDAIIHAAGLVGGIQANVTRPVSFLVENLDIGRNVILAARETGCRRLINLGSSCIYPRHAISPLREEAILTGELEPTNEGYALAKIVAMRLCQFIRSESAEFQFKTLVPCNLYGRHDSFDPARSHLVAAIIHKIHRALVQDRATVTIWGDGSARREFLFAGDLADFVFLALERLESMSDVTNVGVGTDCAVEDYYRAVAQELGWCGTFEYDTSKPEGMRRKLVSIELQKSLGWKPKTSLSEGIRRTYQYYLQEHGE